MLISPDFEGRVGRHPAKPCLGVGDDLAARTGSVEAQEGFLEDLLRLIGIGDDLIGHLEHQASVVLYGLGAYIGWLAQNFLSVRMSIWATYRMRMVKDCMKPSFAKESGRAGSEFVLYDPRGATM